MEPTPPDAIPPGLRADLEILSCRTMTAGAPSVTVAVGLGEMEDSILDCLESVRLQTAAGMDLIVIDRGAPEDSVGAALRWMETHSPRFSRCELLHLPPGRGIAVARDLSFRLARTDSVLLLDADETIDPRCLEALTSALAHCDASLAYCGIATSGVREGVLGWRPWGREVLGADGPFESIALVRRSAWERAGGGGSGRAGDRAIARRDDAGFYERISEVGGWGVMVPEILAHRRLRCEISEGGDDAIDGTDADATLLVRAVTILSAEGPRPLFRKAAKRLAKGFFSLLTPRGERGAPARPDLPPGSSAMPAGADGETPRRQPAQLRIRTPRGPWRFSILSSSLGNCYFHQMRDLIASGIAELGHDVVRGSEQDGFRDDVDWNVVVAPHEFFFLGRGESLRLADWPDNVIIVSTEQPSTRWFAMAGECLERAHAVWDIDHNTSRLLRRRGIAADYLPLGYAPGFADYGHVAELPLHHGTCFLGDEVRRSPAAGRPLRDRPLDLFFVGGNTPRRAGSISVCINHYNRPHLLRQALASIVDQEQPPLEVIVLDDGSEVEGVQAELDRIVEEFAFDRRGWRLIRQRNLYLGASRNALAREARGDYILFMDDDNVAKPHELASFARVARHTDGDVFTCLLDMFEGNEPLPRTPRRVRRHLFTGAPSPVSFATRSATPMQLGAARALIELGGYTEDRGVGHEDWEVYSKFALRGYRIEVIPEALFFYRTAPGSMSREMSMIRSHLRSLRPHLEQIPRPYHALIELAMGQLLARWGYLDPPAREPELLPLRYRVVDAINERIKCLGQMHRLAKRLILAGWR